MKRFLLSLILFINLTLHAQQTLDLSYYLPEGTSYDAAIPTPKAVIGHEVGEWHVTHDKLIQYMKKLSEVSPRIVYTERGTTYEGRPLPLLIITSAKNHSNLENIKREHLALTNAGSLPDISNMPAVVYQGFSIHGNEPSGSNAALALAYYLAAANGSEIDSILNNVIILFDPSFNPDGLQRFSYWANTNRSEHLNPDNNDREFHEVWPGGRTNHYWFDMNRDWLPVQLPESRSRIASFHEWLPNILTDHHEMGTNSSFFFQPGEPSRVHPLTPKLNQELTAAIGQYHVKGLDKIGSLYYSEENYDDYYYGKGSTFPDVNGSIGILFEQGSSRGHVQNSVNGPLTFPFTIRNQFTTGLSTLKAAVALREELLKYQHDFYVQTKKEVKGSKGYVFGNPKDAARAYHLAEILERQQIKVYPIAQNKEIDGNKFTKGHAYYAPADQKNIRLLKAMFETRTEFEDSLFYDISAWTFPLAFDLDYSETSGISASEYTETPFSLAEGMVTSKSEYAYLFEWHEYYTPKALNKILGSEVRAKVGKTPFEVEGKKYDYGTIMIPVAGQKLDSDELYSLMQEVAKEAHITIHGTGTGYTQGIDLGSNDFTALEKPKVGIITGSGITSYDAGEIWHLFDQRYAMQITKLDVDYIDRVNLEEYTCIIIPNTSGSGFNDNFTDKLKTYVRNGGNVIAFRNTLRWLKRQKLAEFDFKASDKEEIAKNITYEQMSNYQGAKLTSGAIFEAKIDRSHPINFGYTNNHLALFRNTNLYLEADKQSYNNPIQYTNNPLLSGYITEDNLEVLKNSVPFKVKGSGRGNIIMFTDNPNFRAFWYGTNKLMMNAVFFGKMM
ncbi:M14 family metallopeptidase [Robertkochia solimangrovi]|uniref:M14 family metallopeptidase n=1 Tax=Robertkochia solimangrovi TaxID=2213046 RepID=UPI00117D0ABF|nr:M14 family metallopeptidase [Robertkochia solimangrovi]TRZ42750.1 zinc carboxypeptidase [Robertkochia solimangrovi]